LHILVDELNEGLWVATLEGNALYGLEIDPYEEYVRSGSIYWARVVRIDKSMDAAFLDLDGENTGLLHNRDYYKLDKDGIATRGGDKEIGKYIKAGDMIPVQAKTGYLPRVDSTDLTMEDKCVRVSMNMTLPGRYLIYAPMMNETRISKRIKDKKQRKQITSMLKDVPMIEHCIIRSAAANTQTDMLVREAEILKHIWEELQEHLGGDNPFLIMDGPDSIRRTLADMADRSIKRIEVCTMDQFQEVEEWCEIYAPDLVTKISPIDTKDNNSDLSLFDFRDILDQIDSLFDPYILLKNGSSIIIQETAALTAIDVNRGQDNGSNLAVNLAALSEIGRQMRLRNLGGIIMIDCLKMAKKTERDKLITAMEEIVNNDPCTIQIHGFTALGLMEITRQRRTPALQDRLDLALD